jgi:hypothetical protein
MQNSADINEHLLHGQDIITSCTAPEKVKITSLETKTWVAMYRNKSDIDKMEMMKDIMADLGIVSIHTIKVTPDGYDKFTDNEILKILNSSSKITSITKDTFETAKKILNRLVFCSDITTENIIYRTDRSFAEEPYVDENGRIVMLDVILSKNMDNIWIDVGYSPDDQLPTFADKVCSLYDVIMDDKNHAKFWGEWVSYIPRT